MPECVHVPFITQYTVYTVQYVPFITQCTVYTIQYVKLFLLLSLNALREKERARNVAVSQSVCDSSYLCK